MSLSAPGYANQNKSREATLLEYAEGLRRGGGNRIAVHIHLSRLQAHNRREHHVRVAASTFEELVRDYDGQIFLLSNSDIVFIGREVSPAQVDEAVTKLRYLFSEDPLTQAADSQDTTGFCTWYRLDRDYPDFLARVRRLKDGVEVTARDSAPRAGDDVRVPLRPVDLANLDESLRVADLTDLVRHQAVCAFIPGQPPKPVFHEVYVSIDDLGRAVAPGKDLAANRWLFQHLTQTLDKRMLAYLGQETATTARAFSLNLNVSTLLSPEFQRFDQRVSDRLRGRLVIELQKIDIFADMGAFRFARDFAHERGYRICLDGLTHLTMPYIDRAKLGVDMIKLFWSPEIAVTARPGLIQEIGRLIQEADTARVILCRCDSAQALEVGRSFGITLFQGRHIERLLQEKGA